MEKIINISGRDVRFKSSGALPLRYKAQFGRDVFADMASLDRLADQLSAGDLSGFDVELFYNIIWTMAKCADPSIPPVIDWVDSFDEFPIFSIFADLQDLFVSSIKSTKN